MASLAKSSGSDVTMSAHPRRYGIDSGTGVGIGFIEKARRHSGGTAIDREDIDALVQDTSHGSVVGLPTADFDKHCGRSADRGVPESSRLEDRLGTAGRCPALPRCRENAECLGVENDDRHGNQRTAA
jgi:hypothetical protein